MRPLGALKAQKKPDLMGDQARRRVGIGWQADVRRDSLADLETGYANQESEGERMPRGEVGTLSRLVVRADFVSLFPSALLSAQLSSTEQKALCKNNPPPGTTVSHGGVFLSCHAFAMGNPAAATRHSISGP